MSKKKEIFKGIRGAQLVVNQGPSQVYKVTEPEALMTLSSNTNWCTTQRSFAENYLKTGPEYVFFYEGKPLAQMDAKGGMFKDIHDKDIIQSEGKRPYHISYIDDLRVVEGLKLVEGTRELPAWAKSALHSQEEAKTMLANISKEQLVAEANNCYLRRKNRTEHPDGVFDKRGAWYPSIEERRECCGQIRSPSRAYPYSLMLHCRTAVHIAKLYSIQGYQITDRMVKTGKIPKAANLGFISEFLMGTDYRSL